jgi:hypothetical protein
VSPFGQAQSSLASPGFEVAEQLAADVPVIIVTGDPVGAYARMQGRVEHFQVLPKPIAAELLEHAVAAAV